MACGRSRTKASLLRPAPRGDLHGASLLTRIQSGFRTSALVTLRCSMLPKPLALRARRASRARVLRTLWQALRACFPRFAGGCGRSAPTCHCWCLASPCCNYCSCQWTFPSNKNLYQQLFAHQSPYNLAKRSQPGGLFSHMRWSGQVVPALNQSIKTQDQQCQWPNKPRPQTHGS